MKLVHATIPLLLLVAVITSFRGAWGQESSEIRTYGTATTFLTLSPWNFLGVDSTVTVHFSFDNSPTGIGETINRSNTQGKEQLRAAVNLPEGAVVTGMEAVFCDTGQSTRFVSEFVIQPKLAPISGRLGPTSTDVEAPGCVDRTVAFSSPLTIDNGNNVYSVVLFLSADESIRFQSLRVAYHLQVSPAPATARFNDVPTDHIFFQFIEALAAAGITGGCNTNPPLYCPDDPVTRGQMAVFIGRALGLQFAP